MEKEIEINGVKYPVLIGLGALMDFEVVTGKDVINGGLDSMGLSDIAHLIHCGIKSGCRRKKMQDVPTVEEFMDSYSFDNITELTEIITSFMPKDAEIITDEMPGKIDAEKKA